MCIRKRSNTALYFLLLAVVLQLGLRDLALSLHRIHDHGHCHVSSATDLHLEAGTGCHGHSDHCRICELFSQVRPASVNILMPDLGPDDRLSSLEPYSQDRPRPGPARQNPARAPPA